MREKGWVMVRRQEGLHRGTRVREVGVRKGGLVKVRRQQGKMQANLRVG